jgi:magnesium transporter
MPVAGRTATRPPRRSRLTFRTSQYADAVPANTSAGSSDSAPSTVFWVEHGSGLAKEVVDADLRELLQRDDGWLWLDVPELDEATAQDIGALFGWHPKVIRDTLERAHVPKMHGYVDHFFLALHRPLRGQGGHVHYLEIDQFVGPNYLVTVHGPRNPVVPVSEMLTETSEVAHRLTSGRLRPRSPVALSGAIVATLTLAQETAVNKLAEEVGRLEQRVMAHMDDNNPQDFLDELFMTRHVLITVRTMAAQSGEILSRCLRVLAYLSKPDRAVLEDLKDQYRRLDRIATSQLEFLGGVSDFYRGRTDTRMTIAAERLAVIAAITLPITAISSIMGMNIIVNGESDPKFIIVVVTIMAAMSAWLLRWARKQGWW